MATKGQKAKKTALPPPQCRRHHGEPINVYSTKYERCMCLKCAMEQHDLLTDFMPISEGVQLMKATGKSLSDELTLMAETTRILKRDRAKCMEKINSSDKNIKFQIRKMRDKLNRHLDLMEQKLLSKLKQLVDKNDRVFHKEQHEILLLENDLKKIKDNVNICLKTGGDMELISGIVQEKATFQDKKTIVKAHQEKVPSKSLQFRQSPAILDFIDTVDTIGEVSLEMPSDEFDDMDDDFDYTHQSLYYRSPRSQHASFPDTSTPISFTAHDSPRSNSRHYSVLHHKNKYGIHASNPYHSFNAQFGQRRTQNGMVSYRNERGDEMTDPYNDFEGVRDDPVVLGAEHETPCNLSGVAALTSGRIVVCDSKHKCLQLINRRSEVLDTLVFHYKPCDIATISENGFVVSFVEKDFLSIYSASSMAMKHTRDVSISGRGGSYSVAFCKNRFALCRRGEIRIVSSDDAELITTIQIQAHFPQIAMSDGGSKIYLSDFVGGKVTCMNDQGKTRWEYSQEELEPSSLAVDLNQIFIADVKGKILIMSTYGILVREIQCVGHLQAIGVDPNTGTVLVTLDSNRDKTKSRSIKMVSI